MLDVKQFRELVVDPTLRRMGPEYASPAARKLVLGTAIQESRLTYLYQLGGGPALGLFQMEPATHDDIWAHYLGFRPELVELMAQFMPVRYPEPELMIANLEYATAMCRMHYRRVPAPLPDASDLEGLAEYWKEHYNTYEGAGTTDEFVEHYREATFGLWK